VWEARVFVLLLVGTIAAAVALGTIGPLLFVGLPSFYGAWFMWFCAVTQHAGLREDVLDHRMSTRTVHMNPVFRFLYLNMNYHVEHHMFRPSLLQPPGAARGDQGVPAPAEDVRAGGLPRAPHAVRMQQKDTAWEIERAGRHRRKRAPTGPAVRSKWRRGPGRSSSVPSRWWPRPSHPVEVGQRQYVLCQMLDGSYAFFDGLCTHGRTSLADGYLDNCVIECPKHNGRFDVRTGQAVRRPAVKSLVLILCSCATDAW